MDFSSRPSRSRTRAVLADVLEPRIVLATAAATTYEQYLLELINRARANPAAEAARLGIDLNEGLASNTIAATAKQPLAMNANLTYAIRTHLNYLRSNSLFTHTGSGGTTPQQRMTSAGYTLSGASGTAENIAITLGSSLGDLAGRTRTLYENLFVDEKVDGRGHRLNLLNGSMEEMGAGLASGDYTYDNEQWTAILAGQDFGYRSGNPFITGVVYEDKITPDEFYSPGEGLESYTITATNAAGAAYTTTSAAAGGYSLQVPAGTYTVTCTGTAFVGTTKYSNVVVTSGNVKRDFEKAQFSTAEQPPPASIASVSSDGTLTVNGTSKRDQVSVLVESAQTIAVQVNTIKLTFAASSVKRVSITTGNGNDYAIVASTIAGGATLDGGSGDDTLIGTAASDSINGGTGNDVIKAGGGDDFVNGGADNDNIIGEGGRDFIHGDDGNDRINGGGGNDSLFGDTNDDRLYGGDGNDRLDGGGNVDKLYGEDGNDALIGGTSNDRLYGAAGDDVFWGNKGKDYIDGGAGMNTMRDRENIDSVLNITA